jgi:hypothetical protein
MRHSEYVDMVRTLATRHKEILHSDSNPRFIRMHLSSNPLQEHLDMKEFQTHMRNAKAKPDLLMVLLSYEGEYSDNTGDGKKKIYSGAIMLLGAVQRDNWNAQDAMYDKTERIGEEVMAALMHQLNETYSYHLSANDIMNEKIGPIGDNLHGTRFSFSFTGPASKQLYYNPSQFLEA